MKKKLFRNTDLGLTIYKLTYFIQLDQRIEMKSLDPALSSVSKKKCQSHINIDVNKSKQEIWLSQM